MGVFLISFFNVSGCSTMNIRGLYNGGGIPRFSFHYSSVGNSLYTCFVHPTHIHLHILILSSNLSLQGPVPCQVLPLSTQGATEGRPLPEAFPDHEEEKRLARPRNAPTSLFACLAQENSQLRAWHLTSRACFLMQPSSWCSQACVPLHLAF